MIGHNKNEVEQSTWNEIDYLEAQLKAANEKYEEARKVLVGISEGGTGCYHEDAAIEFLAKHETKEGK